MKLSVIVSVFACKLSRFVIRLLGRGGTNLPGKIALKLCPDLLGYLAKDVTTIIVTGTNGKTTTSRMIEQALTDSGISFFTNKSGANLLSGVTAEFAIHSSAAGKCRYPFALIESDEAAFKAISRYVDAKAVVVTNVFRDQLDRYGEVTHTLNNIKIGIASSPNAVLCLNADDSLCRSITDEASNPVIFYGVDTPIYETPVTEISDAPYCLHCKCEYVYDYVTYGHLGGYHCPGCGYGRPEPAVSVPRVLSSDTEQSEIELSVDGVRYTATVNLPGAYNIYNACATVALGKALALDTDTVIASLSHFSCGFGRMEKFDVEGTSMRMILVKNPAGCNQVLNFVTAVTEPSVFVVCLNDKVQDGTDISWIWDVDFEALARQSARFTRILVSGVRADDMALRLKYAGFDTGRIEVIRDYENLLEAIGADETPTFIMPTYTAMFDLRGEISKHTDIKAFYE